jgi:carboxyl-terminal processing protease
MLDLILPKGVLFYSQGMDGKKVEIKSKDGAVDLPMAVITNSSSSYAAELFAIALKDFEAATLVGEKTYGKSSGQAVIEMEGGSALILSNVNYTPFKSPSFEGIGIEPEIECQLKADNLYLIDPDRDNQLQEAFSVVWNGR